MRVLVVEDEFLVRDVVVRALEEEGFTVIEAGTGDEALSCGQDVDALFTDIRMPGSMDGWDVAEHYRVRCPDLPVIYATGYSNVEPRRVPGSVFFQKPYRTDEVVRAIRALVSQHALTRAAPRSKGQS